MEQKVDIARIDEYMQTELTERRIRHTEGVVKTAVDLARHYGEDPEKALVAAKCHDVCRKWDEERLNAFIEFNGLDPRYLSNINLAHSKAASLVAQMAFRIEDEDILNAISYHTTGRANMSLLEKIIFLADAIEPGRDYDGVEALRTLAFKDIDAACLASLESTRDYVLARGQMLDEDTDAAIAWLKSK